MVARRVAKSGRTGGTGTVRTSESESSSFEVSSEFASFMVAYY